ncbi:MAG: PAS domain S-box protein, partial [Burkholderiaceae bacterium]|nr:PAS domain S-box protein [Burkholderiaceae bacterium]
MLDSIVAHGIAVLDIDGRVLQWNAGAERTSGHRAADIVGRHVSLLYPAEAIAAGTPQRELDAARDGDGAAIEGERIRADGRRFWAEIALSPVRDAAGSLQGFALLMRDLSARRVAQRQHDEAALRLRAIVDTAVDGVITINERGVMESANRAAERLFGWRAAEMIGRNVSMLMPQPDRGAHDGYLRRYKVTGERRIIGIGREVLGQRRDGTTFPMELAVSETPLPDGRRIFTGLVRDVSDRKRIEAELLAADRRKDEFLAVLAHELRNPLAPIANALQVLKLAAGQPEHVNSLREVMERQTRQLVRLIDDLMDVSRITSGKLALRRGRVQLADIVATAVETSRSAIDAAGHRLVVDLPEAAVWLDVDPLRIAQVFSNLLANAARYTPPGGRLSLSARSDGARVQVEVSDNGIGIPAA